MKIKSTLFTALLAVAATAMLTGTAHAYQLAGNLGDLILGFQATAGTGQPIDVEYDLGNEANLVSTGTFATGASSLNLEADLANYYGTSGSFGTWNANTNVLWSVVGADSSNDIFFTVRSGGTPQQPTGNQTTIAGDLGSDYTVTELHHAPANTPTGAGYTGQGVAITWNDTSTPDALTPLITNDGATTTDFNYFTASSVQNALPTGASPVSMNLYEDVQGGSSPTEIGTFTLSTAGVLTFTDVPEPSTYAFLGFGSLALLIMHRRRRAIPA